MKKVLPQQRKTAPICECGETMTFVEEYYDQRRCWECPDVNCNGWEEDIKEGNTVDILRYFKRLEQELKNINDNFELSAERNMSMRYKHMANICTRLSEESKK